MKSNPFPVIRDHASGGVLPWNLHRLPLDRLPILDQTDLSKLQWLLPNVGLQFSARENSVFLDTSRTNTLVTSLLVDIKRSISAIFRGVSGLSHGKPSRLFGLRDAMAQDTDTILFVPNIRYDLASHTMVCDAFVLTLTDVLMPKLMPWFEILLRGGIESVLLGTDEVRGWKQLLPALAERCRTWTHQPKCEYTVQNRLPPLSVAVSINGDPLCSCGRGKAVDGMLRAPAPDLWKKFAPFVTRVALSPLFAVSYLEPVISQKELCASMSNNDPSVCARCHKSDKDAQLLRCSQCKIVTYCSNKCQKAHWKAHKPTCMAIRSFLQPS